MTDALLVLNAGSSRLKPGVFCADGDALLPLISGVREERTQAARFHARDAKGAILEQTTWPAEPSLGHAGALLAA